MRAFEKASRIPMGLVTAVVLILLSSCQSPLEPSNNEPVTQTVEFRTATASALPAASTGPDSVETTATPAVTSGALPTASLESDSEEATETPPATDSALPTASPEPDSGETTINPGFALLYQAGRERKEIYESTFTDSRLVSPGDLGTGQPFSPDRRRVVIVTEPSSEEERAASLLGILNLENGAIEPLNLLSGTRTVYWSPDGKQLLYIQRGEDDEDADRFVIYDFEKRENIPIVEDPSIWRVAGWSHDGRMVAFVSNTDDRYDLNIIDMDTLEVRRITDTIEIEAVVLWSPVANELLVGETSFGPHRFESPPFPIDNIYLIDEEGNSTHLGSYGRVLSSSLAWSTSGDSIAYSDNGALCVLALDTGRRSCPLEDLPPYNDYIAAFGSAVAWSPNDEWLAFRAAGYRQNNCDGVYIIELSTKKVTVVEEGSCETGYVYWVEVQDSRFSAQKPATPTEESTVTPTPAATELGGPLALFIAETAQPPYFNASIFDPGMAIIQKFEFQDDRPFAAQWLGNGCELYLNGDAYDLNGNVIWQVPLPVESEWASFYVDRLSPLKNWLASPVFSGSQTYDSTEFVDVETISLTPPFSSYKLSQRGGAEADAFVWSPDEQWVYFSDYDANGILQILRSTPDGQIQEQLTHHEEVLGQVNSMAISPDGRYLAYGVLQSRPATYPYQYAEADEGWIGIIDVDSDSVTRVRLPKFGGVFDGRGL